MIRQNNANDLYQIYTHCFPDYPLPEEEFYDSLKPDSELTHTIRAFSPDGKPSHWDAKTNRSNGTLCGFALVNAKSITLMCVLPEYRNQGLGTWLLNEAENFIRKQHKSEPIILGHAEHYIFQGVPVEYGAVSFFEKRGYCADETTVNMWLKLEDYDFNKLNLPEPEGITFRLATEADEAALWAAIDEVLPEWHALFNDDKVMLAMSGNQIVGFQQLDIEGARFRNLGEKAGFIGCVGIIKDVRKQGIGRRMVTEGIKWIKEQGGEAIELLYVAIPDWYERLGFEPVSYQWMGKRR